MLLSIFIKGKFHLKPFFVNELILSPIFNPIQAKLRFLLNNRWLLIQNDLLIVPEHFDRFLFLSLL